MIASYKQITTKYLKANMKRTVLTVVGIIMSVALISSICLFFQALKDSQVQFAKSSRGSYHVMFDKLNKDLYEKIIDNPKIGKKGMVTIGKSFKINDKLSGSIITATGDALKLLPFKCSKGRLPNNKSEIAIQNWMLRYFKSNLKVGDKIDINNNSYVLSGILTDDSGNQLNDSGTMITKDTSVPLEKAFFLVELNPNTDMKAALKEIENNYIKNIQLNAYLISTEGLADDGSMVGLYVVIIFIIGIVLIATIAVIYNSFQISVVERIKQFGLLRAIGTTPAQIKKIILREASILAVIGIPIGLVFGVVAIYCISFVINIVSTSDAIKISPSPSPMILIISSVIGVISIYASALIPAHFAGKISPLEAISSRTSIKKEKIKKTRSFAFGKLLGFEGNMARKNIKRNKNRYRITVFSIVISVSLFITFKSFMDMVLKMDKSVLQPNNIHFAIAEGKHASLNEKMNDVVKDDTLYNKVKNLKLVKDVYKTYVPETYDSVISTDREVDKVKEIDGIYKKINIGGTDEVLVDSLVEVYDKNAFNSLKKYIISGTIDSSELNKENGVILVNYNEIYNEKTQKTYVGGITNLKVGDEIILSNDKKTANKAEAFEHGKALRVKVLGIVNDETLNTNWPSTGIKLIATQELGKKLFGTDKLNINNLSIVIKNIQQSDKIEGQLGKIIRDYPSLKLINYIDSAKDSNSAMLIIQILMYGFVIVVSLIGSVNIINTVTTNIILRKREFGVIKCIGLTQKSLKKMISYEGLIYGIVGTFYGSILGSIFSYLIYLGLNGMREIDWNIPWNSIAIAGMCAIIIGYLSVLSPLSRINKENLVESVREE